MDERKGTPMRKSKFNYRILFSAVILFVVAIFATSVMFWSQANAYEDPDYYNTEENIN